MITPFPPQQDGVAEYSNYLVNFLSKENLTLYVFCQKIKAKKSKKNFKQLDKINVFRIWNPKSILNQFSIIKKILHIKPDIIHVQFGPYAEYGGLLGEPLLFLFFLLKLLGFKCVVTLHSVWLPKEAEKRAFERINLRFFPKIAALYYYSFIKVFLTFVDSILVCVNFRNSEITEKIASTFRISHSKINEMIHGNNAPTCGKDIKSSNQTFQNLSVLFFGFIRKDKGYEYAIEAISILKKVNLNIKLIVAGNTISSDDLNYLEQIKTLVNDFDVTEQVFFDIRYIPSEEIATYFSSADVLILPYSRRVGPSGPLALAVSYGLPIIMTVHENFAPKKIPDFVKLIAPESSIELANAIQELCVNEDIRRKMILAAYNFAFKYDFSQISKEHRLIYSKLIEN